MADESTVAMDHLEEESEFWTSSAIKRLDHVHDALETIAQHSGDQATIDTTQHAREMIEETQADLNELRDAVQEAGENGD